MVRGLFFFCAQESKKHFDEDDEFKKRAYADVVRLQNGDSDVRKTWKHICDLSIAGMECV